MISGFREYPEYCVYHKLGNIVFREYPAQSRKFIINFRFVAVIFIIENEILVEVKLML